jgi:hypothetical protein
VLKRCSKSVSAVSQVGICVHKPCIPERVRPLIVLVFQV